jgi:hypothetical protein
MFDSRTVQMFVYMNMSVSIESGCFYNHYKCIIFHVFTKMKRKRVMDSI